MDQNKPVTPRADNLPEQELVDVDIIGPVPLSTAHRIYRSIAKHFGGRTNLTAAERKSRAEHAARSRWGKDDK